jgi:hypothetical protein
MKAHRVPRLLVHTEGGAPQSSVAGRVTCT